VKDTKVNAGLAESNGKLLLGLWRDSLHVTFGLTASTPGSAPGPTLGNEYGKTLPLPLIWLLTTPPHLKYVATLPCNLMACFADVNVSQGSVATYARCGGMFNNYLTENVPGNLPLKKFYKSVKI